MALITIIAVYYATESYQDDIEAMHAAERKLIGEAGGSTSESGSRVR